MQIILRIYEVILSRTCVGALNPHTYRMLVTMEGFDGRLMQALAALQATCPWLPASAAGAG